MSVLSEPERALRLYVLERNLHHLSNMMASEQNSAEREKLRTLFASAEQDLQRLRSSPH